MNYLSPYIGWPENQQIMNKSYKIEDDFAKGFIESKCKIVVELPTQDIESDLLYLRSILGGTRAERSLYIGRGGSHIYISDCYKNRMAIIYYRS